MKLAFNEVVTRCAMDACLDGEVADLCADRTPRDIKASTDRAESGDELLHDLPSSFRFFFFEAGGVRPDRECNEQGNWKDHQGFN
jgi:hypothetical protein